jgi:hypothetical protein
VVQLQGFTPSRGQFVVSPDTPKGSGGGFGFPGAISQLTVDSPQLGLEIALLAAV